MSGVASAHVTRSSLVRLSRRLDQVEKGAALLEKRRDALVSQLFARVRPTIDAQRGIEQQAGLAYRALADALSTSGRSDLAAFGWPSREMRVQLRDAASPVGTAASNRFAPPPTLVRGTAARAMVPGQFDAAIEKAARAFERLLETVLATAPEDFAIRQLGRMLARTVRQVNVLEQLVAVDLARERVHVRRTLDEREREEAVRLRRIAALAKR
ncbi:MAG: V-type ATP synthase subunit D [Caldimonas sp.]